MLGRCDFTFVNLYWLLQITFLSFVCLEVVSRRIYSITFSHTFLFFLLALLEDRSDIKSYINCMGNEKQESSFLYMFSVT